MSKLKFTALTTALILAAGAAAHAGGYTPPTVEPPVIAPIVEEVVPTWQGGYVGATLGYAFNGDDRVGLDTPLGFFDLGTVELEGFNAGLRVGYRWQRDRWVFGPELGFEGGNINNNVDQYGYEAHTKIKNVIALRGKAGYVMDNDMLVYGTLGVARAKIEYQVHGDGPLGPADIDDSYSKNGYIVGIGVEKKLNDRLSLTGEYEYANFGKQVLTAGDVSTRATPDYHNVKVGVNFAF